MYKYITSKAETNRSSANRDLKLYPDGKTDSDPLSLYYTSCFNPCL